MQVRVFFFLVTLTYGLIDALLELELAVPQALEYRVLDSSRCSAAGSWQSAYLHCKQPLKVYLWV